MRDEFHKLKLCKEINVEGSEGGLYRRHGKTFKITEAARMPVRSEESGAGRFSPEREAIRYTHPLPLLRKRQLCVSDFPGIRLRRMSSFRLGRNPGVGRVFPEGVIIISRETHFRQFRRVIRCISACGKPRKVAIFTNSHAFYRKALTGPPVESDTLTINVSISSRGVDEKNLEPGLLSGKAP